jgi:hypothetical protein
MKILNFFAPLSIILLHSNPALLMKQQGNDIHCLRLILDNFTVDHIRRKIPSILFLPKKDVERQLLKSDDSTPPVLQKKASVTNFSSIEEYKIRYGKDEVGRLLCLLSQIQFLLQWENMKGKYPSWFEEKLRNLYTLLKKDQPFMDLLKEIFPCFAQTMKEKLFCWFMIVESFMGSRNVKKKITSFIDTFQMELAQIEYDNLYPYKSKPTILKQHDSSLGIMIMSSFYHLDRSNITPMIEKNIFLSELALPFLKQNKSDNTNKTKVDASLCHFDEMLLDYRSGEENIIEMNQLFKYNEKKNTIILVESFLGTVNEKIKFHVIFKPIDNVESKRKIENLKWKNGYATFLSLHGTSRDSINKDMFLQKSIDKTSRFLQKKENNQFIYILFASIYDFSNDDKPNQIYELPFSFVMSSLFPIINKLEDTSSTSSSTIAKRYYDHEPTIVVNRSYIGFRKYLDGLQIENQKCKKIENETKEDVSLQLSCSHCRSTYCDGTFRTFEQNRGKYWGKNQREKEKKKWKKQHQK